MSQLLKERVRHSFDMSAQTYDAYADFQLELAGALYQRAEEAAQKAKRPINITADLGCGPGELTARLSDNSEKFGTVIGLDLSFEMTRAASKKKRGTAFYLTQADAEFLPIKSGSCDLVTSNLMLQWTESSAKFFAEVKRVLSPGGFCIATTLGPLTFHEIRESMTAAGGAVGREVGDETFMRFDSVDCLMQTASDAGLKISIERTCYQRAYGDIQALLRVLKKIGAQGGGSTGLGRFGLGRRRLMKRFFEEYAKRFSSPLGISITYEALFITAKR